MKPTLEVADIFRRFGPAYRAQTPLSLPQLRAMRAIEVCRTAVLGGHVDQCNECGAQRIAYNSCRNRHCPKCQALDKEAWLEARQTDLLPIPYFHVVFTLPKALRPWAACNPRVVYDLLFQAASQTLKTLARDPQHLGANIGCIALLHTWSQTLAYHPHLHCIVTGGGLAPDGRRWVAARSDFFLPVKVLARLFRGKFLAGLKQAYDQGQLKQPTVPTTEPAGARFKHVLTALYQKEWVVYCKPPLGTAQQTLAYLARYTHRVALSNERLVQVDDEQVTFRYRDRQDHNRLKRLTLPVFDFIRRFLRHVLPHRFVKIRHYGLLSNRGRATQLPKARQLLGLNLTHRVAHEQRTWQQRLQQLTGRDVVRCRQCGQGQMVTKQQLLPQYERDPPYVLPRRA